jgi:hypothetical protein
VVKHHQKFGLKCDWITEVKTTAWKKVSQSYIFLLRPSSSSSILLLEFIPTSIHSSRADLK